MYLVKLGFYELHPDKYIIGPKIVRGDKIDTFESLINVISQDDVIGKEADYSLIIGDYNAEKFVEILGKKNIQDVLAVENLLGQDINNVSKIIPKLNEILFPLSGESLFSKFQNMQGGLYPYIIDKRTGKITKIFTRIDLAKKLAKRHPALFGNKHDQSFIKTFTFTDPRKMSITELVQKSRVIGTNVPNKLSELRQLLETISNCPDKPRDSCHGPCQWIGDVTHGACSTATDLSIQLKITNNFLCSKTTDDEFNKITEEFTNLYPDQEPITGNKVEKCAELFTRITRLITDPNSPLRNINKREMADVAGEIFDEIVETKKTSGIFERIRRKFTRKNLTFLGLMYLYYHPNIVSAINYATRGHIDFTQKNREYEEYRDKFVGAVSDFLVKPLQESESFQKTTEFASNYIPKVILEYGKDIQQDPLGYIGRTYENAKWGFTDRILGYILEISKSQGISREQAQKESPNIIKDIGTKVAELYNGLGEISLSQATSIFERSEFFKDSIAQGIIDGSIHDLQYGGNTDLIMGQQFADAISKTVATLGDVCYNLLGIEPGPNLGFLYPKKESDIKEKLKTLFNSNETLSKLASSNRTSTLMRISIFTNANIHRIYDFYDRFDVPVPKELLERIIDSYTRLIFGIENGFTNQPDTETFTRLIKQIHDFYSGEYAHKEKSFIKIDTTLNQLLNQIKSIDNTILSSSRETLVTIGYKMDFTEIPSIQELHKELDNKIRETLTDNIVSLDVAGLEQLRDSLIHSESWEFYRGNYANKKYNQNNIPPINTLLEQMDNKIAEKYRQDEKPISQTEKIEREITETGTVEIISEGGSPIKQEIEIVSTENSQEINDINEKYDKKIKKIDEDTNPYFSFHEKKMAKIAIERDRIKELKNVQQNEKPISQTEKIEREITETGTVEIISDSSPIEIEIKETSQTEQYNGPGTTAIDPSRIAEQIEKQTGSNFVENKVEITAEPTLEKEERSVKTEQGSISSTFIKKKSSKSKGKSLREQPFIGKKERLQGETRSKKRDYIEKLDISTLERDVDNLAKSLNNTTDQNTRKNLEKKIQETRIKIQVLGRAQKDLKDAENVKQRVVDDAKKNITGERQVEEINRADKEYKRVTEQIINSVQDAFLPVNLQISPGKSRSINIDSAMADYLFNSSKREFEYSEEEKKKAEIVKGEQEQNLSEKQKIQREIDAKESQIKSLLDNISTWSTGSKSGVYTQWSLAGKREKLSQLEEELKELNEKKQNIIEEKTDIEKKTEANPEEERVLDIILSDKSIDWNDLDSVKQTFDNFMMGSFSNRGFSRSETIILEKLLKTRVSELQDKLVQKIITDKRVTTAQLNKLSDLDDRKGGILKKAALGQIEYSNEPIEREKHDPVRKEYVESVEKLENRLKTQDPNKILLNKMLLDERYNTLQFTNFPDPRNIGKTNKIYTELLTIADTITDYTAFNGTMTPIQTLKTLSSDPKRITYLETQLKDLTKPIDIEKIKTFTGKPGKSHKKGFILYAGSEQNDKFNREEVKIFHFNNKLVNKQVQVLENRLIALKNDKSDRKIIERIVISRNLKFLGDLTEPPTPDLVAGITGTYKDIQKAITVILTGRGLEKTDIKQVKTRESFSEIDYAGLANYVLDPEILKGKKPQKSDIKQVKTRESFSEIDYIGLMNYVLDPEILDSKLLKRLKVPVETVLEQQKIIKTNEEKLQTLSQKPIELAETKEQVESKEQVEAKELDEKYLKELDNLEKQRTSLGDVVYQYKLAVLGYEQLLYNSNKNRGSDFVKELSLISSKIASLLNNIQDSHLWWNGIEPTKWALEYSFDEETKKQLVDELYNLNRLLLSDRPFSETVWDFISVNFNPKTIIYDSISRFTDRMFNSIDVLKIYDREKAARYKELRVREQKYLSGRITAFVDNKDDIIHILENNQGVFANNRFIRTITYIMDAFSWLIGHSDEPFWKGNIERRDRILATLNNMKKIETEIVASRNRLEILHDEGKIEGIYRFFKDFLYVNLVLQDMEIGIDYPYGKRFDPFLSDSTKILAATNTTMLEMNLKESGLLFD